MSRPTRTYPSQATYITLQEARELATTGLTYDGKVLDEIVELVNRGIRVEARKGNYIYKYPLGSPTYISLADDLQRVFPGFAIKFIEGGINVSWEHYPPEN